MGDSIQLTDLSVNEFLERLGSSDPVPGGGSAAALAGCHGRRAGGDGRRADDRSTRVRRTRGRRSGICASTLWSGETELMSLAQEDADRLRRGGPRPAHAKGFGGREVGAQPAPCRRRWRRLLASRCGRPSSPRKSSTWRSGSRRSATATRPATPVWRPSWPRPACAARSSTSASTSPTWPRTSRCANRRPRRSPASRRWHRSGEQAALAAVDAAAGAEVTAKILDGRTVASRLWRDLSDRIADLHERTGATPRLAIVRLDARGPSAVYAASVWRAARSVGVDAVRDRAAGGRGALRPGGTHRRTEPRPEHRGDRHRPAGARHTSTRAAVVELIDPAKDVDGATPLNAGRIARGERTFVPATALAVMAILRTYGIPIAGKRAVVVGRSAVVGRPAAALLLAADATVQVTHRRTRNLARETRRAEILVVAAGQPAPDPRRDGQPLGGGDRLRHQHHPGRDRRRRRLRRGAPGGERHHPGPRRRRAGHDHDAAAADGRRRRARPSRPTSPPWTDMPCPSARRPRAEPARPNLADGHDRCRRTIISSTGTEPSMKPSSRIVS